MRYINEGLRSKIKKVFVAPLDNYIDEYGGIIHDEGKKFINETLKNLKLDDVKHFISDMHLYAEQKTDRDTYQAMESLIHNLCTLASRAGSQVPFSSVNFGICTSTEGRMVSKNLLLATDAGLGNGETAIFPISIFKIKKGVNHPGDPNYDLFKLACKVSARRLFPNMLNLDSSFNLPYYSDGKPEKEVASMGMLASAKIKVRHAPKDADKYDDDKIDISDFAAWVKERIPNITLNKFDDYTVWMNLDEYDFYIWDDSIDSYTKIRKWLRSGDPKRKWVDIQFAPTFLGAHRPAPYIVRCTTDHPFPVLKNGAWERTKVRDIKVGDEIHSTNSRKQIVEKITPLKDTEVGYDFQTVSDRFSIDKVVVHNCRTRVIGNVFNAEKQITPGRGNLFMTTLNLPFVALLTKEENPAVDQDTLVEKFFIKLKEFQDECFDQQLDRLNFIGRKKAYNFPFMMGQHLYLDSEKIGPNDDVMEVIKNGTLTTGFIGLAECLKALTGKHHGESAEAQELGLKIVRTMCEYCQAKANETKLNFSLMGTPAEGCAGRLLRATRKRFGVVKDVTDREYLSNSHHVCVHYNISAWDKIKIEGPYHKYEPAG